MANIEKINRESAERLRADMKLRADILYDIEYAEQKHPGKYDHRKNLERVAILTAIIKDLAAQTCIEDEHLTDAVYHAINTPTADTRHITIDDLPKAPRHPRPPKKINPATHAKKMHHFIMRINPNTSQLAAFEEGITHIESGKSWNWQDRNHVTPDTFMNYV